MPSLDPAALVTVTADQVVEALREAGGNRTQAARALGLGSRYQLLRLIKKHGLAVADEDQPWSPRTGDT